MGGVVAKLAFLPPPPTYAVEWTLLKWLTTAKGERIPFIFIEYNASTRMTILFSHANAEDLGLIFEHMKTLSRILQVNVMAYDYTGYGHATGVPSESDCYSDIAACLAYLLKERDLLPSEIILYGRSLGSGPTVELASKTRVGGIVLQSGFTSCIRVAYDVKKTAFDAFCNVSKMHRIVCPALIIHGTDDDMIPIAHAKELFRCCRNPHRPFWVEGANHNDIETGWCDELCFRLQEFIWTIDPRWKMARTHRPHVISGQVTEIKAAGGEGGGGGGDNNGSMGSSYSQMFRVESSTTSSSTTSLAAAAAAAMRDKSRVQSPSRERSTAAADSSNIRRREQNEPRRRHRSNNNNNNHNNKTKPRIHSSTLWEPAAGDSNSSSGDENGEDAKSKASTIGSSGSLSHSASSSDHHGGNINNSVIHMSPFDDWKQISYLKIDGGALVTL